MVSEAPIIGKAYGYKPKTENTTIRKNKEQLLGPELSFLLLHGTV